MSAHLHGHPDAARIDAAVRLERAAVAAEHVAAALSVCHRDDAAAILSGALEAVSAGMPPARDPFGDLRADAAYWADTATPAELEAYGAAALRAIERTAFAERARKRLLVALWNTLPEGWRRDFVARVDPDGHFFGRRAA